MSDDEGKRCEALRHQQLVAAYRSGFEHGLTAYAHSYDGELFVGTESGLLKNAIKYMKQLHTWSPPEEKQNA